MGTSLEQTKLWYVLQTYAGSEKKTEHLILEQLRLQNLESLVEEIFIPSEQVKTKHHGKEYKKTITYFPGYMWIKMQLVPEVWHLLTSIPRVSGFIGGTPMHPKPISEAEMEKIRAQIREGKKQAEIDSTYQVGQSVRVIEGPFADFNGTIEVVDSERNRLTVSVSIFGRSTPLEIEFDKVKLN